MTQLRPNLNPRKKDIDTMNQSQVKYLKKRIEDIRDEKITKSRLVSETQIRNVKTLSREDKVKLAYAGKAKLKPLKEIGGYMNYYEAFEFPQEEKAEEELGKLRKSREEREATIISEAAKIIDMAVFKDAEEALKMLEAFAKF